MNIYEENTLNESNIDPKKELFDLIKKGYIDAEKGRVNSLEEVREILNKKRENEAKLETVTIMRILYNKNDWRNLL